MRHEQIEKIKKLYHSALECDPAKRNKFLLEACQGDQSLLAKIKSLIDHGDEASEFFSQPAWDAFIVQLFLEKKAGETPEHPKLVRKTATGDSETTDSATTDSGITDSGTQYKNI